MANNNLVTISGRVSRQPRRIPQGEGGADAVYVFPLAVRVGPNRDELVFPEIVIRNVLPPFVKFRNQRKLHEQALITVIGEVHTHNLNLPLVDELVSLARRGEAPIEVIAALQDMADALDGCTTQRVVTEIVAVAVAEGGDW